MSLKLKKIMKKRKGFTLLEVLLASLALAVVATLLFSLTTNAHLTTLNITGKIIAQNIAQATMEDIKAQNNYFLEGLINRGTSLPSCPPNDGAVGGSYHVNTSAPISLDSYPTPLFKYTNPTFTRDVTITDSDPGKSIPDRNYSIIIKVTWMLNSTGQSLIVTGTKTNVN